MRGARSPCMLLMVLAGLLAAARSQGDEEGWQDGTLGELGFETTYNPASGGCGYGDLPPSAWPFGGFAAIDPAASPLALAAGVQQGCGICLEVQCTDAVACSASAAPVVVLVTDYCAGCGADVVYLAPSAYDQAAVGAPLGKVGGRFRQVNCNPPGDIIVHVDTYRATDGGWVRLALKDVAGAGDVGQVELTPSASPEAWRPMKRNFGATWELTALPAPPLDLRATDGTEQTVVARRALQQAQAGDVPTGAQFQASQTLASALGGRPAGGAPPTSPPAPGASPSPTTFESIFGTPRQPPSPARVPAPEPLPVPQAPSPPSPPPPSPPPSPASPSPTIQLVTGPPAPTESVLVPSPGAAPSPPPFFVLPLPTSTAPEVVDTRPARAPGVGPSVTPAPVVFSPVAGLPTFAEQPPAAGPLSGEQLAAVPGYDEASCQTLGEILDSIPQVANWTQLLRSQGLDVLLRDRQAQGTLLVPVDSALGAAVDARPLRNESTISQLVINAPEIQAPLVGYHVLPGLWPSWALQPGTQVDTSDTINKVDRLQITATSTTSLQGIGSSSSILQRDIAACGPSVIHIVDQVLLPFTFDQAAIDAVSGTSAPLPTAAPLSRIGGK